MSVVLKNNTLSLLDDLLNNDNISPNEQQNIRSILQKILNTKKIIAYIKLDIENIIKDNKFDQNDIPHLIKIVINIFNLQINTISGIALIKQSYIKYLVYGLLIQLVEFNSQETTDLFLTSLKLVFPNLWSLVDLSLIGISKIKVMCSNKCC